MATAQLSFFESVKSFAKPFVKVEAVKDPLQLAKTRFATVCDEQVRLLKDKKDKGFWFNNKDGVLIVSLKNGAAVMKDCTFQVKDAAAAIKLIEAAKVSASKGEFDQLFKDTARKPVQRKPKADAPATPSDKK